MITGPPGSGRTALVECFIREFFGPEVEACVIR
jgi:Ni2+-binding GTPase involved in maturation of urease and hydrogenase